MDIFSEKKLLVRIIIVLALLNIMSIGVFLWKSYQRNPPPPSPDNNKDVAAILKNELELSPEQVAQVRELRADFMEKEKELSRTIKSKRDSMNAEMFNKNTNDTLVKSLAKDVAKAQNQMELLRYEQSKAFKAICTPAQLEKFEDLVKEMKDYFKPDNANRKQNRKKR